MKRKTLKESFLLFLFQVLATKIKQFMIGYDLFVELLTFLIFENIIEVINDLITLIYDRCKGIKPLKLELISF